MLKIIILIAILCQLVHSGKLTKDDYDKLGESLDKTGDVFKAVKEATEKPSFDLESAFNVVKAVAAVSGPFFSQLAVLGSFIGIFKGLFGGESEDSKVIKELNNIKESIGHLQDMITIVGEELKEEFIKSDFRQLDKTVDNLQDKYDDWSKSPDNVTKTALVVECGGNKIANVLRQMHTGIVNKGNGYLNQLLDGGPLHEMPNVEKWSRAFLALYVQASFLRSVCFPLIQGELDPKDWKDALKADVQKHKNNFDDITKTITDKITDLKSNYWNNANKAMDYNRWHWLGLDGCNLMKKGFEYLNTNFNPEKGKIWNVVVISKAEFNHIHSDKLIHHPWEGKRLFAGYATKDDIEGPTWYTERGSGWSKELTIIKIGGMQFNMRAIPPIYFWMSNGFSCTRINDKWGGGSQWSPAHLENIEYVEDKSCGKPKLPGE